MDTKTKKAEHILDRIRPMIDELYPKGGKKPDPVKAARVRKELLSDFDLRKRPSDELAAVGVCLESTIKRAVFDAVSENRHRRERAYGYFSTVRESGANIEKMLAVDRICGHVKLRMNEDLKIVAMTQMMETKKLQKLGEVEVFDGTGRVQMIEKGDLIGRAARMLMTLQDPNTVDVLFETGRKLGDHPLYVELGRKVTEIAEKIQEEARKEKAKEFGKYVATEPPGKFEG